MRKLLLSLSVLAGLTAAAPVAFAAAPHAERFDAVPGVSAAVQPVEYRNWRHERAHRHDNWRRDHHHGYSGRYYR